MNKQLIGTLVGALILFFWQFLSWGPLNIHGAENQYTEKQDQIMEFLNGLDLEEGSYFMPNVPVEKMAERQELLKANEGKPWAKVFYHKDFSMKMGMNLIRGAVIDLVAAFFLVWILMKFEKRDLKNCLMASLAVGLIGYLTIPYLETVWYKVDNMGHLVDAIVPWTLIGTFLGWYLNRK